MATHTKAWKTKGFWEDLLERVIRTFGQALIGALPIAYSAEIDWINAAYIAGFAALLSVLTGIVAGFAGPDTGASFGTSVPREAVRTVNDATSPTEVSTEEGSDLESGTPVFPEEPLK